MKTKVIFRKHPDGEVFALFPRITGTYHPGTCSSYARIGQHGSADVLHCTYNYRLASPAEYRALAKELRKIGYKLDICQRTGRTDYEVRKAEIAKVCGTVRRDRGFSKPAPVKV